MMKNPFFLALFLLAAPTFVLAETPQNPEKPKHYIVKNGDCLWNISKDIYGDPLKWPMLYVANQDKIRNPNLIYDGQRFSVPLNFTKEDLRKATLLANEKAQAPGGVVPLSHEGSSSLSSKSPAEKEVQPVKKEAPAAPEQAVNPPTGTQETKAASTPSPASSDITSAVTIIIVALLTILGGFFLWKKGKEETPVLQEPKPLSSFPEMKETPTSQATPATPPVVAPSEPQAPSAPAASSPIPSPAPETPAEPPQAQLPLDAPAAPTESEKRSDDQAPPASPGHAA